MRRRYTRKSTKKIFIKFFGLLLTVISVMIALTIICVDLVNVPGVLSYSNFADTSEALSDDIDKMMLSGKTNNSALSQDIMTSLLKRSEHILQMHNKIKDNKNNPPTETNISMECILQYPELPTGCESVSLTMVLNYLGFDINKTDFVDNYLIYATEDFPVGYMGNPFSILGAGIFPPGLAKSANCFFFEQNSPLNAFDISGSDFDTIKAYIASGIPIIMWITSDYEYPFFTGDFVIYNDTEYDWYQNEHCVVLTGYSLDKNIFTILDPLCGQIEFNIDTVLQLYNLTGMYAIAIY